MFLPESNFSHWKRILASCTGAHYLTKDLSLDATTSQPRREPCASLATQGLFLWLL